MTYSAQQARNTPVFVISSEGTIEETNLYDHIAESAEKTTSPRGIMYKLFIEQDRESDLWQLKMWGFGGRGPAQVVETFETEEQAEDEWFARTEKYDFARDDQRDTQYFFTREEAEKHRAELYPEIEE